MINRLIYALVLLAVAGVLQPASAASAGAAKSPVAQLQQRTPGDAQIERTLKAKLAKSKLNADHFTVSVAKGVVTIEGNTNVMQHKGAMTRMAKLSGATSVQNNIRISDAAKAKAAASLAKHRPTSASPRTVAHSAPTSDPPAPAPIPRATVLPAGTTR